MARPRLHPPKTIAGEETLGQRLTRLRTARGITQVALAHRLGTVQTVVSEYELDHRRIHAQRLREIAEILQVSADALLGMPTTRANGNGHGELSLKLVKRLKGIEALPRARQKAVLQTLDFLLKGAGS
jgi:transcriptional regulator with XRE-family HTH domain